MSKHSDEGKLLALVALLAARIKSDKELSASGLSGIEALLDASMQIPEFTREAALQFAPRVCDIIAYPVSAYRLSKAKRKLSSGTLTASEEKFWTDRMVRNAAHVQFKLRLNLKWYGVLLHVVHSGAMTSRDLRKMLSARAVIWTKDGDIRIKHASLSRKALTIFLMVLTTLGGIIDSYNTVGIHAADSIHALLLTAICFGVGFMPVLWVLWFLGPFEWSAARTLESKLLVAT